MTDTTVKIKVLGSGCHACDLLETNVRDILATLNIAAEIEHVRDVNEIANYGIMGTPALVVNNEILLAGRTLPKSKLTELLKEKLVKK